MEIEINSGSEELSLLNRKAGLLKDLLNIVNGQSRYINELDIDRLEQSILDKNEVIKGINRLDKLFRDIRKNSNGILNKEEEQVEKSVENILLQIKKVDEANTHLLAQQKQKVKEHMDKENVKDSNLSESYFIDRKA